MLHYYKYRFHRTTLYDLLTHSTHGNKHVPPSPSLAYRSSLQHILDFLPLHIFLLEHESFVLHVFLFVKYTSSSRHVKFGTPLNHVHFNMSRFHILIRTLIIDNFNTSYLYVLFEINTR